MTGNKESLTKLLAQRFNPHGPVAKVYLDDAREVIVFGSMAAGLERPDSDIDVLCIGESYFKLKTHLLDLIVIPQSATKSVIWLQSELATHAAKYGIWTKGTPLWKQDAHIGALAVREKRRRVAAFINSLQGTWFELLECFRAKYALKLRREVQRMILMEDGVPVPPTRTLDQSWASLCKTPEEVCDRLREFGSRKDVEFLDDLLNRVESHFGTNQLVGSISQTFQYKAARDI